MDFQHLRALVREYDVGFHVRPELSGADSLAPIGYTVELTATHGRIHDHPMPGCPECQPVARALFEIAKGVSSHEEADVRCDIHVDTARHDMDGGEAMMTATVSVLRSGSTAAAGSAERHVLDEIVRTLRGLGAKSHA